MNGDSGYFHPHYPQRQWKKPKYEFTIGILDGSGRIVNTATGEVSTPQSYEELKDTLFLENGSAMLLFYDGDLADLVDWCELLEHTTVKKPRRTSDVDIPIASGNIIPNIVIRNYRKNGKRSAMILPLETWRMAKETVSEIIDLYIQLVKYVDVGVCTSSASFGQAIISKIYTELFPDYEDWKENRHFSLPFCAMKSITSNIPRGAYSAPGKGMVFPIAYSIDQKMAYIEQMKSLPCGTTYRLRPGTVHKHMERFKYYFVRCKFTITSKLPIAILQDTTAEESSTPTLPGKYEGWNGMYAIEYAKNCGVEIEVIEGFGWKQVTEAMMPVVHKLEALRRDAPNEYIEKAVKQMAVSIPGYWLQGNEQKYMTAENADGAEVHIIYPSDVPSKTYIVKRQRKDRPYMAHWGIKCIDATLAELKSQTMPRALRGTLISEDTDGFYSTEDESDRYPVKTKDTHIGEWALDMVHTNMHVTSLRGFKSDQRHKGGPR